MKEAEEKDAAVVFRLYEVPSREPFLLMYGFCSGWSKDFRLEPWQQKLVERRLSNRAVFERGQGIGRAVRSGEKPMPSWLYLDPPGPARSVVPVESKS